MPIVNLGWVTLLCTRKKDSKTGRIIVLHNDSQTYAPSRSYSILGKIVCSHLAPRVSEASPNRLKLKLNWVTSPGLSFCSSVSTKFYIISRITFVFSFFLDCASTHVSVPGASDHSGESLGRDKFCGNGFGAGSTNALETKDKPFVVRVKTGPESTQGSTGFLFLYELTKC